MRSAIFSITVMCFISGTVCSQTLLDGYTDKLSYRAGETVHFYTRTDIVTASPMSKNIVDMNDVYLTSVSLTTNVQSGKNLIDPWVNGFNYSETGTWQVSDSVKSGLYKIVVGMDPINDVQIYIPIIIKAKTKTAIDVVVVVSSNTDLAYCYSGGKNLYNTYQPGPSGRLAKTNDGQTTPSVSFHRPLWGTLGELQNEASDYYVGFMQWMEASNRFGSNNVSVIADQDMDDYTELSNAKLLIIIGHSEYWTRKARNSVDQFVDSGKDAIVLSGNTFWWQVRYSTDNSQMICYKGNTFPPSDSDTGNVLLKTINWNDPSLKFSILGSVGADWGHARYGTTQSPPPLSMFGGYKIIQGNSPLINGVVAQNSVLTVFTGEYDGILVKGLDSNNYPILDQEALGFYKAELVGYDISYNDPTHTPFYYAGLLALQKTNTSGKIIHAGSNGWCWAASFQNDGGKVATITQNMITLLLSGSNIFSTTSSPSAFTVKPPASNTSVSYQTCNVGVIDITPGGVFLTSGYRIDQTAGFFSAVTNIDCTGLNFSGRKQTPEVVLLDENQGTKDEGILLYPNPIESSFHIRVNEVKADVLVFDVYGAIVYKSQLVDGNSEIDASGLPPGLYVLKVQGQSLYQKKLIKR